MAPCSWDSPFLQAPSWRDWGFGVSRLQVAMVTSLPTLYGTGSPINFPGTSSQVHLLAMSLIECYEDLGVFYILLTMVCMLLFPVF